MRGLRNNKPYKYEADLTSLSNSDGSYTDLSLRSKSQITTTSIGASSYDKSSSGVPSSNESGKNIDDGSASESSGADNINTDSLSLKKDAIPEHQVKDGDDSQSPTPIRSSPSNANFLPIQKLSIANMKAHDLEQAKMKSALPSLGYVGEDDVDEGPSKSPDSQKFIVPRKRKRKIRRGKRKCKLPVVASSLGRQFPLPNPKEIELYSRKEDAVHLDPRIHSKTSSSSSTGAELSSSESSSR